MSAASEPMESPLADIGWILSATLSVLRRRGLDLALVALPFVWLPNAVAAWLPPELTALRLSTGIPALVFFGGASLIAHQEIVGAARVTPWRAIGVGLKRYFTLFMINAVTTLMALAGFMLLVAPGLFVLAAFMSATTIAVVEDQGSTAALERSWMLSRGSRGRLAGLLCLAVAAYAIMLLITALVGVAAQLVAGDPLVAPIGQRLLAPIITTLLLALSTVGSAAAYVNLRNGQEGPVDVAEAFA